MFIFKIQALKKIPFLLILIILSSCVQENLFEFEETVIREKGAQLTIEVIYPKLNDESDVSSKINNTIETTLAEQIAFFEEDTQ